MDDLKSNNNETKPTIEQLVEDLQEVEPQVVETKTDSELSSQELPIHKRSKKGFIAIGIAATIFVIAVVFMVRYVWIDINDSHYAHKGHSKEAKEQTSVITTESVADNTTNDNTDQTGTDKPLILIEDQGIDLREVMFYAVSMQLQYEQQYGPDVMSQDSGQGGTVGDMVKSQALEDAQNINLAVYEAEQSGIILTDVEKQEELDQSKIYFEGMDPVIITEYGFTQELLDTIFIKYTISRKMFDSLSANFPIDQDALNTELETAALYDPYYAAIAEYGAEGSAVSVRAKHILISTLDENQQPLPQDQIDAALVVANEALARAKAGEDFSTLIAEYSEDPGSLDPANADGYIFARGDFVSEFEDAAYSMQPGDISEIVQSQYGYHIIKLEEKDIAPSTEEIQKRQDYEANIVAQATSFQTDNYIQEEINSWKEKYSITIDTGVWDTFVIKGQTVQ